MTQRPLSCSASSAATDEPLAGTAYHCDGFVWLEHAGPWPPSALECLDPTYADELSGLYGIFVSLIRRPGTSGQAVPADRAHTFVSTAGRAVSRTGSYPDAADIGAALSALEAGDTPEGWQPVPYVIGVCAHAKRDACCAKEGRVLAQAFADIDPEVVWEITHLHGHRFAPTCLTLPSGVTYGRVAPQRAGELLQAISDGRVVLDLMRGRGSFTPAVQTAEVAARTEMGITDDTVQLVAAHTDGDLTTTSWIAGSRTALITVERRDGIPRKLSCAKDVLQTRSEYVVV